MADTERTRRKKEKSPTVHLGHVSNKPLAKIYTTTKVGRAAKPGLMKLNEAWETDAFYDLFSYVSCYVLILIKGAFPEEKGQRPSLL